MASPFCTPGCACQEWERIQKELGRTDLGLYGLLAAFSQQNVTLVEKTAEQVARKFVRGLEIWREDPIGADLVRLRDTRGSLAWARAALRVKYYRGDGALWS